MIETGDFRDPIALPCLRESTLATDLSQCRAAQSL